MPSQETSTTYGIEPANRESTSLLAVLRRRALIVVVVTLLAGGAAAAFAYATRDTYESTAKLLFQQTIGSDLNARGLLPGAPDADNLAQNNVAAVGSRRVAVETARQLESQGVDTSPDDVASDVTVSTAVDTDVVEVLAQATSGPRAAQLATAYVRSAADLIDGDQRQRARETLSNVQQQLAELPPAQAGSALANGLREDIAKLRTLAEVGTSRPQIIQRGYVPDAESGNPLQTILLGLLFGALLGVGLALVREQADRRLHRADQVSAAFDSPVLTTVPRSRALKRHRPFADLPPEVAEAFRMLQMNLRFARSEPVRSVLVTSSRSEEGKTTVAWNLAAAAASAGLSVALVEADLRRPTMAERYGIDAQPGLTEALRGEIPVADALQTLSSSPAGANGQARPFHVLVAGTLPPDPWALMQSSVMTRVLDLVGRDHDLVVIDTPPIPHVSDAISLVRRVDGVIVAASVNSTRGPEAARLRDQLQELDARILGVVANGGSAASGYGYAATGASRPAGDYPGAPMDLREPVEPRR